MQFSRKRVRYVAPLILVALGAAACGGSSGSSNAGGSSKTTSPKTETANAVKGGTLNMLGVGDVDYLDPNITYYTTGYMAARMYSRQLFTYGASADTNTKALPDLAQAVPTQGNGISADGLTYTIKMRPDAMWSTSPARAVTAQDFVRGVKRTCNPVTPFGGLPDYEDLISGFQSFCDGFAKAGQTAAKIASYQNSHDISGVKAVDAQTIQFTLTHPAAYFVDMLTLVALSPAPQEFDNYVPASLDLAKHMVSDGPYKIDSYNPTKSIEFSRNPAWTESADPIRKAYVENIKVDETGTQQSIQQQLQTATPSADVEWDTFPQPTDVPALKAANDPNLNIGFTASSNPYVIFNFQSPNNNGVLAKPEMRQALMYATNRAHLIQALGGTTLNSPLTHILPSSLVGGQNGTDLYPYDVAKAKQLLSQAGFPNGITLKFLYRNSSAGSTNSFQTIQQDWKAAGINVVGVPVSNADFYVKYLQVPGVAKRGVWDVSLAGWGADWYGNAALSFFKPLFYGQPSFPPSGSNYGYYNSQTAIDLINKATSASTQDEAATLWAQADKQVMTDAAIYPITVPNEANYHATQVHNAQYIPQLQGFDPTNVWLDPSKNGG